MSNPADDPVLLTEFLDPKELAAMAAAAREATAPPPEAKTVVLRAVGGVISRPPRFTEETAG